MRIKEGNMTNMERRTPVREIGIIRIITRMISILKTFSKHFLVRDFITKTLAELAATMEGVSQITAIISAKSTWSPV